MRRVAFNFDDKSLTALDQHCGQLNLKTWGEGLRVALARFRILQKHALEGFTEVEVRNPRTGEARIMSIPSMVG